MGRSKERPRLRWMDDVVADLNEDKAEDGEDERQIEMETDG